MKKEKQPGRVNPRGACVADPLAVVPLAPANVELRRDSGGLIHLRLNVPVRGLKKRLADWLGYKYEKIVELDDVGTLFYERVDGRRTLREIAGEMAGRCGRSPEAMKKNVLAFTRSLMRRNLILLQVGGAVSAAGREGAGGGQAPRESAKL